MAKKRRCTHRLIRVETEADRCSWVKCLQCNLEGPCKHSYTLAVMAWALFLTSDHPERRAHGR